LLLDQIIKIFPGASFLCLTVYRNIVEIFTSSSKLMSYF